MSHHSMIICAGLPSSASTWIFNIVAELERNRTLQDRIVTAYAEDLTTDLEEKIAASDLAIVKCHNPQPGLRISAAKLGVPVILSVRSPHDSVASLMQRFAMSFDEALNFVLKSCEPLIRLAQDSQALILKYEDGFETGIAGIEQIARHLGHRVPKREEVALAKKFSPEAVQGFIDALEADGSFNDGPPAGQWDPDTHWHPHHIGDKAIGKYLQVLTGAEITQVSFQTRAFCAQFGYEVEKPRCAPATTLLFSNSEIGVLYFDGALEYAEAWGSWLSAPCTVLTLPLSHPVGRRLTIEMTCVMSPNGSRFGGDCEAEILLNGRFSTRLPAGMSGSTLHLSLNMEGEAISGADSVKIEFRFSSTMSPMALNHSADPRLLALGLISLRIVFDAFEDQSAEGAAKGEHVGPTEENRPAKVKQSILLDSQIAA